MKRMSTADVFALLEQCAIKGERCPQTSPHGPLPVGSTSKLARAGKIRVEIFMHNWRVVTILVGPHKGKQTKASPNGDTRPYSVTDVHGTRINGRVIHDNGPKREGPSAPRDLSYGIHDPKEGRGR